MMVENDYSHRRCPNLDPGFRRGSLPWRDAIIANKFSMTIEWGEGPPRGPPTSPPRLRAKTLFPTLFRHASLAIFAL